MKLLPEKEMQIRNLHSDNQKCVEQNCRTNNRYKPVWGVLATRAEILSHGQHTP